MAKKYIDAELLRKAVEKQIDYAKGVYPKGSMEAERATAIIAVCLDILASIDSLRQEQSCDTCTNDKGCVTCKDGELWEGKEQPSEDLKKAARDYTDGSDWQLGENLEHIDAAFIAGAEWQAERLLKGSPMPEDTVIFQKGIEEGKRLMMEDAVEGKVFMSFAPGHNQMVMADVDLPTNTKVKIVIVKEEE